jgi:hypothetical protein
MGKDPKQYIRDLREPELAFADSKEFEEEVERVKAKLEQKKKDKSEGQGNKKELSVFP